MTGGNEEGPPGVYPAMHARSAPTTGPPARPGPAGPSVPAGPPSAAARRRLVPVVGGSPGTTGPAGGPADVDADVDADIDADTRDPAALEPDEFSAFYRATWPGVARALAVALGDRDLAVDATDEAMARAYPRWSRLRGYDNPGAWVYRVGLNWARSHRRRLARRPPVAHVPDEQLPPVGDPAVHAALMDLPLGLRSVVVCRLLLDWSVADTATALGVRPGTVQSRLHRALRSLHDTLDHLR